MKWMYAMLLLTISPQVAVDIPPEPIYLTDVCLARDAGWRTSTRELERNYERTTRNVQVNASRTGSAVGFTRSSNR